MKKLLLAALLLLSSPALAQNVFFPANPGDMIVKGTVGAWTGVPGGTAGCALISNGPTAAPTWQCALPLNFGLPPIATNRFLGNASGVQAPPSALTINQVLDTVGYDTLRTPTNGSLIVKEPATGTWQALVPSPNAGWVLTSAGSLQTPVWAFTPGTAAPGAIGTCLVSNGPTVSPTYQNCLTGLGSLAHGHIIVGNASNAIADYGTLATFGDTGTLTLAPVPASTTRALNVVQTSPSTGSADGRLNFNSIEVNNQWGALTGGGRDPYWATWMANALWVKMTVGGSNLKGFQNAGFFWVDHSIADSNIGTADIISVVAAATSSKNANGHGLYGIDIPVFVASGGSHGHVVGANPEVGIFTGGAADFRSGIRLQSLGQVLAGTSDAAITTWADTPTDTPWKHFISLNESGTATISTTGDLINATQFPTFTVANILNFPTATVSGSILKFPHANLFGTGFFSLNSGASAQATPFAGSIAQLTQDGASNITLDSFGGGGSVLVARGANGPQAIPTTLVNTTSMGGLGFAGYNSSAYSGVRGGMFGAATQTWTTGANGMRLSLSTTPNGSVTTGEALGIEQDKTANFKGPLGLQSSAFVNYGIGIDNTAAGGRHWDFLSLATTSTLGAAGAFIVFDETAALTRLQISSAGALKLGAYGAGTLVSDASGNITASAGGLVVGTTAITSGTSTRVLFDNAGVLGEYTVSGSGNVCMTTSCIMVTPTLGVATATSVNGLGLTGTGTLTGTSNTSVGQGQYLAVASATAATAGNIGELVSSTVATGSAVSLTTDAALNMTSISLTAGEWDVSCNMVFKTTGTTATKYLAASLGTVTNTLNANPGQWVSTTYDGSVGTVNALLTNISNWIGPLRISLGSTTTYYCVAQAGFTTSTMNAYGLMRATRVH